MKVLVIGANGQVGRKIVEYAQDSPFETYAMIRDKSHASFLESLGAKTILADLEDNFSEAIAGMDYVVFTAGSGSKTGPDKTIEIDQEAAKRCVDYCLQNKVKKFIMVSAQGAKTPEADSPIQHYFKAKYLADQYIIKSGIDYIIFRPGRLNNEDFLGKITLSEEIPYKGSIRRADLAKCIVESLKIDTISNKTLEILEGDTPINLALSNL